MSVRLCFSHEDKVGGVVHLAPYPPDHHTTLCGERAFLASLSRRKITCEECLRLKPKQMGGSDVQGPPRPDYDPRIDHPERYGRT